MTDVTRIEKPQDAQLIGKLEKKLEEYRCRLERARINYKAPEQMKGTIIAYYDSLYKAMLLERVLADGKVDVYDVRKGLEDAEDIVEDMGGHIFENAVTVINDYCTTGGACCVGGTGLESK